MIFPRKPCATCGTSFTPSSEHELECGECHVWQRDFDDWGSPVEAPYRLRDRSARRTADDELRSLENYKRAAKIRR